MNKHEGPSLLKEILSIFEEFELNVKINHGNDYDF